MLHAPSLRSCSVAQCECRISVIMIRDGRDTKPVQCILYIQLATCMLPWKERAMQFRHFFYKALTKSLTIHRPQLTVLISLGHNLIIRQYFIMSAIPTGIENAFEVDPTHNDEKAMVASTANLERGSIGTAHRADANATTVCFGTIQEVFTQNITLQQLFAAFDCTQKAPDESYFDWIAGEFAYVFPKAGADLVRAIAAMFVVATIGQFHLANQVLANLGLEVNQIPQPNQVPLLPPVNGRLQPLNAGAGQAPINPQQLAKSTQLMLGAVGWYLGNRIADVIEGGLQSISSTIIDQIKSGTSQMSIITVINGTHFPFQVTDSAAYKGDIVTTFYRLEGKESVEDGSFANIGIFSSNSTLIYGSASAITLTSLASSASTQDKFIVAAAAPITGRRTTLISINDPNQTAYGLADLNDTQGQGQTHAEGDGAGFHLWADVEQGAVNNYCHVRVLITEH